MVILLQMIKERNYILCVCCLQLLPKMGPSLELE